MTPDERSPYPGMTWPELLKHTQMERDRLADKLEALEALIATWRMEAVYASPDGQTYTQVRMLKCADELAEVLGRLPREEKALSHHPSCESGACHPNCSEPDGLSLERIEQRRAAWLREFDDCVNGIGHLTAREYFIGSIKLLEQIVDVRRAEVKAQAATIAQLQQVASAQGCFAAWEEATEDARKLAEECDALKAERDALRAKVEQPLQGARGEV